MPLHSHGNSWSAQMDGTCDKPVKTSRTWVKTSRRRLKPVLPAKPRNYASNASLPKLHVPLLAVGKDIYCDSKVIFDDNAWEQWGFNAFADTLGLAPSALMTPAFVTDRKTIYPLLARSDFNTLRPSALADLISRLTYLEHTVFPHSPGPFLFGAEVTVADIHAFWGVRWDLQASDANPPGMGAGVTEPQVSREKFPRVWRMIDALPLPKAKIISFAEARGKIEASTYFSELESVQVDGPTRIKQGADVTVDALGSDVRRHPVHGKLVATSTKEIVIEVPTGLRLHFPREGQILREVDT
ncbi:Putative glutathione S-transferase domain superfamily [Septoria linicola]|uniref:Glutathione S-transferase domain superfamily n=1 Tax=Septoria linicola TaxID=215465 RepID=A0A9Q9ATK3_9PEZI|nr:Putative glutathione S-transferase domain superfamily [Septoria linicola]